MQEFERYSSIDQLDSESKILLQKAKESLENAYAPYSQFQVASALLLDDGTVVIGTNQENAAYPSGLCAERVAVFAANSQHPSKKIVKVVVVARKFGQKDLSPASSCGGCRQVMVESEYRQQHPIKIVMYTRSDGWVIAPTAASLLPFTFTKNILNK